MPSKPRSYDSIQDLWEDLFQKALKYLAYKPRTEHEVIAKLKFLTKDITNDVDFDVVIESVMAKLRELRFVNDTEYINMYVESFIVSRKAKSVSFARNYLLKRGLDKELIDEKLQTVSPEQDIERVKELALRKLNSLRKKFINEPRKIKESLYRYLVTRGYKSSDITSLIDTIINLK